MNRSPSKTSQTSPNTDPHTDSRELFAYHHGLDHPVIGMESEFTLFLDGRQIRPEEAWSHPSEFVDVPLLHRSTKASQLPTGGALYFDGDALEMVTPVIEVAPRCTSRMVRSMWEQIGFVRDQLTSWQQRSGHEVRMKAFSSHYNISFELSREERNKDRTIQKLALLLAYLLPVPVMVLGANRRSTGVGVRPRRDRIEITVDFTPDPGLMLATAALIVGIARDVIAWPSYRLEVLGELGFPLIAGVVPGKHTSRKGWLTREHHFERSPFTADIDAALWQTTLGKEMSLRELSWRTASFFRRAISAVADPFTYRILFSILEGRTPSMLELPDRPAAYDDIGRSVRWGTTLPELNNFAAEIMAERNSDELESAQDHPIPSKIEESELAESELGEEELDDDPTLDEQRDFPAVRPRSIPPLLARSSPARRASDLQRLEPPWNMADSERRAARETDEPGGKPRGKTDRRASMTRYARSRLDRSMYEETFVRLAQREPLTIDGAIFRPSAIRGWYEAELEDLATHQKRVISINQLAAHPEVWLK